MRTLANISLWFLLTAFLACQQEPTIVKKAAFEWDLPAGFAEPIVPANNEMTVDRVRLGKMLFFDPILSVDSTMSCSSCHLAEAGFADHHSISLGVEGRVGARNAPTLTNIGYHPYFFREGGSPTLEQQVLGPICNNLEMGFNAALLAERLKAHPIYEPLAQESYGREIGLFVLTRAIASYERTMISGDSPYDRFSRGEDPNALSAAAQRGLALFKSERANCTQCHGGTDFSLYDFANNGLYDSFLDQGRYAITLDSADIGKFKVPTLRNIALSWPYMHDGSLKSLEEVVDHYNRGGQGHVNQSSSVRPLGLDQSEIADLVAFLESLTDEKFVNNPAFAPE
ncbi:MAG: cytochrome-c peroxidase [Bacteroidia bacterium]